MFKINNRDTLLLFIVDLESSVSIVNFQHGNADCGSFYK